MQKFRRCSTQFTSRNAPLTKALILLLAFAASVNDASGRSQNRGDAALSPPDAAVQAAFQAKTTAEAAILEPGLAEALSEGKAVLLFPLYGTSSVDLLGDRETGLGEPYSLDVSFVGNDGAGVKLGEFNLASKDDPTIIVYQADEPIIYSVRVVEPGTWTASGMRIDIRAGQMPDARLKRQVNAGGFGKVKFTIRDFPEQIKEAKWAAPTFRARDITQDVCLIVHVVTGACVSWGEEVVDRVSEVVSSGGWYDVMRTVQRPGIEVAIQPAEALASVTVEAGEVLLLDGLYFKPPGIQFVDECIQVGGQSMSCELNSIEYQVWPSDATSFIEAMNTQMYNVFFETLRMSMHIKRFPAAADVFSKAQYRAYSLAGASGWRDEAWGGVKTCISKPENSAGALPFGNDLLGLCLGEIGMVALRRRSQTWDTGGADNRGLSQAVCSAHSIDA